MGGESNTRDFFRLFMIPDYGMCAAMFPGTFDALGAVQKWVEEDAAPDQIKATYGEQGRQFRERAGMQDTPQSKSRVLKTRPVCPYPQVAIYKGSGDTNDAANFQCGKPTWK
jgi:feruloyl esterase